MLTKAKEKIIGLKLGHDFANPTMEAGNHEMAFIKNMNEIAHVHMKYGHEMGKAHKKGKYNFEL